MDEKQYRQIGVNRLSDTKRKCTLSIITNCIIVAAVLLCSNAAYETSDDYAISIRIAGGYPYIGYVNYYLCRFLIALQTKAMDLNIYVLFLLTISLFSFIYITRIILEKSKSVSVMIVLIAFLIIFSFDHYCAIQYTKTSALVLTVGFIGLIDSVIEKRKWTAYAISGTFVFLGASIRFDPFKVTLGMTVVAVFAWVIVERKKIANLNNLLCAERIVPVILIIVIIVAAHGFIKLSDKQNSGTDELQYAAEYNKHRINIVDYPTYSYYDQNKKEYDKIGISENDLFLITKWIFDYDGAASFDNFKKIDEIGIPHTPLSTRIKKSIKKTAKYVLSACKNQTSNGIHIIVLVVLAIGMIIILKPRHWLYVVAIGGAAVGIYVTLHFIQRVNYRTTYIADVGASLWLLYYYAHTADDKENKMKKVSGRVLATVMIVMAVAFVSPLYENCQSKYERALAAIMSEETAAFFKEHKDEAFVWTTGEKKFALRYATPFLVPDKSDANVFNTGSWNVLTPFVLESLRKYGMNNPIKDLIDNDKAYLISNKMVSNLEEYYEKWYADETSAIKLKQVSTVEGQAVWKVERVAR